MATSYSITTFPFIIKVVFLDFSFEWPPEFLWGCHRQASLLSSHFDHQQFLPEVRCQPLSGRSIFGVLCFLCFHPKTWHLCSFDRRFWSFLTLKGSSSLNFISVFLTLLSVLIVTLRCNWKKSYRFHVIMTTTTWPSACWIVCVGFNVAPIWTINRLIS